MTARSFAQQPDPGMAIKMAPPGIADLDALLAADAARARRAREAGERLSNPAPPPAPVPFNPWRPAPTRPERPAWRTYADPTGEAAVGRLTPKKKRKRKP